MVDEYAVGIILECFLVLVECTLNFSNNSCVVGWWYQPQPRPVSGNVKYSLF